MPLVSPATVHEVVLVVQVLAPDDEVTVYEVMGMPPVATGGVHDTVAWV